MKYYINSIVSLQPMLSDVNTDIYRRYFHIIKTVINDIKVNGNINNDNANVYAYKTTIRMIMIIVMIKW